MQLFHDWILTPFYVKEKPEFGYSLNRNSISRGKIFAVSQFFSHSHCFLSVGREEKKAVGGWDLSWTTRKCLIDIWAPLKENSGSRIHSFILNHLLLHFQSSDHKICRTKLLHNTVLQVNFFFPSSALYWPLKHQKIVQHCTNWRTHTHVIEIKSWFFL